jgi:hypothetical protein
LAAVDRDIAKAKALIVRQEILVARLAAIGGDVARARQALEAMRQSLRELHRHRRLIVEETATASR